MATKGFDWKCRCGKVELQVTPGRSREVTCYCNHCRHFAEEYGEADTLDDGGGVAMAMLTIDRIRVLKGGEELAAMHYSPTGPLRWYTRCCGTPVGITAGTGKMPYLALHAARLEPGEALGPPLFCPHAKSATGPVARSRGIAPLVFAGAMAQVLGAKFSGRWKTSPFFGEDGAPVAEPELRPWSPG